MMKLYKEHNINPLSQLSGCLPILVQWPIIGAGIGFCAATACGLVNSTGNTNTLVATVAFRNEPYTPGT